MKKKEADEAEVTVKAKDINRLLNEIQKLKINQAKITKKVNGKGEKPQSKKKMTPLPKQDKATPKKGKKPSNGKSNKSKNNGKTKNTSKKQQL